MLNLIKLFMFALLAGMNLGLVGDEDYYRFFNTKIGLTKEQYEENYLGNKQDFDTNPHFSKSLRSSLLKKLEAWRTIFSDEEKLNLYNQEYSRALYDQSEPQLRNTEGLFLRPSKQTPAELMTESIKEDKPRFLPIKLVKAVAEQLPRFRSARLLLNNEDNKGIGPHVFHDAVDKIPNTLVLVKTINEQSKKYKFIGGYTDKTWDGNGMKDSKLAFAFSVSALSQDQKDPHDESLEWKVKLYPDRMKNTNAEPSIFCDPMNGPFFVNGFMIGIKSNGSGSNTCLFGGTLFDEEINQDACGSTTNFGMEAYAVYRLSTTARSVRRGNDFNYRMKI